MKTVDKALTVLDQFSLEKTEIGLSELARMAGTDKAATRRLLVAMARHGFVEQVEETRKYRLGPGFLRLSRIREATVPVAQAAREVADWLCDLVQETTHISVPGTNGMTTIAHKMPNKGRVININPSQVLPFHATASGLAFLAYASSPTIKRLLALKRDRVASNTVTGLAELDTLLAGFREQGHSHTRNSFEEHVASMAMPFFCGPGDPAGTVSMALSDDELTEARKTELLPLLQEAVARMETAMTGD